MGIVVRGSRKTNLMLTKLQVFLFDKFHVEVVSMSLKRVLHINFLHLLSFSLLPLLNVLAAQSCEAGGGGGDGRPGEAAEAVRYHSSE